MHVTQLANLVPALAMCSLLPLLSCEEDGAQSGIASATPGPDAADGRPAQVSPDEPLPVTSAGGAPAQMPVLSCGGLLGGSTCDPVTAWPCDVAGGETCDFSNLAGAFRCYAFPVAVPFCGLCDDSARACGPGTTCGASNCERYCCQDSDCERGRCVHDIFGQPAIAAAGYCPEDSYFACGSDLGDVMYPDAGQAPDAGR